MTPSNSNSITQQNQNQIKVFKTGTPKGLIRPIPKGHQDIFNSLLGTKEE